MKPDMPKKPGIDFYKIKNRAKRKDKAFSDFEYRNRFIVGEVLFLLYALFQEISSFNTLYATCCRFVTAEVSSRIGLVDHWTKLIIITD